MKHFSRPLADRHSPPWLATVAALAVYGVMTAVWYFKPERKRLVYVAPESSPDALSKGAEPSAVPAQETTKSETVGGGWWALLVRAGSQWAAHKDARLGAALAYYSIFSLGPLIVVVVAVAGLMFEEEAVRGEVSAGLRGLLGDSGAESINTMLVAADKPQQGIFATVIGIAALVFAAIGVVVQLKDALNTVWEVETSPGKGIWGFARTYVLSLAGVLALGFLLLVSLLLTTALSAAGQYFASAVPEVALQAGGFAVSFMVIAALFAMMFKWLPDAKIDWRDVWLGAVLTAALFELGKFLIALYIGKQGLESTYGAAASIVIVLIWVYYSAQIVLFGAELTRARSQQRSSMHLP